jgi:hypothetical protein
VQPSLEDLLPQLPLLRAEVATECFAADLDSCLAGTCAGAGGVLCQMVFGFAKSIARQTAVGVPAPGRGILQGVAAFVACCLLSKLAMSRNLAKIDLSGPCDQVHEPGGAYIAHRRTGTAHWQTLQ